jgi:hypothetical protein
MIRYCARGSSKLYEHPHTFVKEMDVSCDLGWVTMFYKLQFVPANQDFPI